MHFSQRIVGMGVVCLFALSTSVAADDEEAPSSSQDGGPSPQAVFERAAAAVTAADEAELLACLQPEDRLLRSLQSILYLLTVPGQDAEGQGKQGEDGAQEDHTDLNTLRCGRFPRARRIRSREDPMASGGTRCALTLGTAGLRSEHTAAGFTPPNRPASAAYDAYEGRRSMRLTIFCLLALLVTADSAHAEYTSGFTLFDHTKNADSIVLASVEPDGRATVLEVLKGKATKGATLTVDKDVLRHSRWTVSEQAERAFLFLAGGHLVEGQAGVGWIEKDVVHLLPDNWGSGVCYPLAYRDPSPAVFRSAVLTAMADVKELARLATLKDQLAATRAASALLRRARKGPDWYVTDVAFLGPWMSPDGSTGYLHEVAMALEGAGIPFTTKQRAPAAVRAAWREAIADLKPGPARRAHWRVLSWSVLQREDAPYLEKHFRAAADLPEREATGTALLRADPTRALVAFGETLAASRPGEAVALLHLAAEAARLGAIPRSAPATLAAPLVPGYLKLPRTDDKINLGYAIADALGRTKRLGDARLLLSLARAKHNASAQALVELRQLTQKKWEAQDAQWDAHLASLKAIPPRK